MSEQEILFSTSSVADPYVVMPENLDTFSNILNILSDDGELRTHPPPTSTSTSNKVNMPPWIPVQTGQSSFSRKNTKIDAESSHHHHHHHHPRNHIQEGRIDDEGTGSKRRRFKERCSKLHASSERKRRDRLREKLSALKELLADTSSKFDQAALLDEAASRIRSLHSQLQALSLSMGRMHLPAFAGYQTLPRTSASGFVGQAGIGIEPGMQFQVPYIPFQFHQMAAPFATCVVPSVLIPRLDSTLISTNPIPGEHTGYQTVIPSTFLNSHPGISQVFALTC
ncbi:Transcription factor APG [Sesamum alatum]|uniref:Transcription factor APG n=1 Tax=Sesamum alatum TaxID=300844 RepID=A0AAE1Y4E1_9LAMI|nr:Transcription factor APG [Sesamum alatum]